MKKLFLSGALTLLSVIASSQQTGEAISFLPFQASNFLILDAVNNPDVTHWKIEIQQKYLNAARVLDFRTINESEIWGTYFTKIRPEYAQGDYFISVTGLNSIDGIVVEEGPIPICPECPVTYNACSWKCVGDNYAYKIT